MRVFTSIQYQPIVSNLTNRDNEHVIAECAVCRRRKSYGYLPLVTLLSAVVTKKNANDVYENAEMLLRDGVDVNECDSINETALHKIAHTIPRVTKTRFIVPIISLLLKYSANTNIRNTHGKTCWEIAYGNHSYKIGDILCFSSSCPRSESCNLDEVDNFRPNIRDLNNGSCSYSKEVSSSFEVDSFRNATAPPLEQLFNIDKMLSAECM